MLENYIAIYIIDIIALLFLFGLLYYDNFMSQQRKKAFSYAIFLTIFVILSEVGTTLVSEGDVNLQYWDILFNVLGFAIAPMIPIVLITIFDTKVIQKYKVCFLPTIINLIAVILSPIFGWIFQVDVNNHYQRGSIFLLFVIVYMINILLLMIINLYAGEKFFYPIKGKIAILSFFIIAGSTIQLFFPAIHASWHCVTIVLILFYILISEFEASFDLLTELYNRAAFEKAVRKLKSKKKFSIIVMDINNFKTINDTLGHEYGDMVLKEVAMSIRSSFNEHCNCYRIGGDEICIIDRETDPQKLQEKFKKFTDNLIKTREKDSHLPTVAYGYSSFSGDEPLDFKKMFREADEEMYYYKNIHKKKRPLDQKYKLSK